MPVDKSSDYTTLGEPLLSCGTGRDARPRLPGLVGLKSK